MHEEKNQIGNTQTKVELQIIPCEPKNEQNRNHQTQHECGGKLILTITCDGSKLTKADSGRLNDYQDEVWITLKTTKADAGRMPEIDLSIHERCGAKLTIADAGKTA